MSGGRGRRPGRSSRPTRRSGAELPQAGFGDSYLQERAPRRRHRPPDRQPRAVRPARAAGAGVGLGAVTGFLGVGGGFLAVPALVSVLDLRMRAAVGTSLLVITVNSLAALIARAGTHTPLNWAVIAPFTGAAILGAWDGKRLAATIPGPALQRTFASVLLAVAALMVTDALH